MIEDIELYKIDARDNTSPERTSNPAQVNLGGSGAVSDGAVTNGLTEQQVRDIVGQNISTGLKEDQVRSIISSALAPTLGTIVTEDQIRNIAYAEARSANLMTEPKVRAIVNSMQQFLTGNNIMMTGIQKSQNFYTGVSGWQIDAEGNAEFNDGTFRGTFNIGGTSITIDNTQDIQTNLDTISTAGGGILYLQPGTYTLTADISIPAGVTLQGVNRDRVIIDCNTSYKVQIVGSDAYSTGTVTIANGGTTVTGVGTTWTAGMVGQFIYLGKNGDFYWYEITARASNTSITIATPYGALFDLSGNTYTIATINKNAHLSKVTVQNATGVGVKQQYTMECNLNDIYVTGCGTGLDFDQSLYPIIVATIDSNGVNADWNEVSGYKIDFSTFTNSTTGNGITMLSCGNATFFDTAILGNFGDGLNMTNCHLAAFISMDVSDNGGQGIELVSNCDDNQFMAVGADGNTSDGFKLTATADRNVIANCSIKNNGGYGINIAASTCDNNQIISPAFTNNTSGNINDGGTSTTVLPPEVSIGEFGGDGSDGALSIASGTTTIDLGGAQFVTKNYTSISITSTGKLAFSNPHASGTIITLKSKGKVTLTSSEIPCIDASGMGGAGGAASAATAGTGGTAGTNGTQILDTALHYGGGGLAVQVAGVQMTTNSIFYTKSAGQLQTSAIYIYTGSGGGSGAASTNNNIASGAGGNGGGGLLIESRGALNFTGTISVSGATGLAGTNATSGQGAGGGGGGSAGSCLILYNSLTANSGTITASGGNGGNGGSNTSGGSASGNRGSGGNGAGSYTAAGGAGGDANTAGNNAAGLGAGAGGGGGALNDTGVQISGGTGGGTEGGLAAQNKYFN